MKTIKKNRFILLLIVAIITVNILICVPILAAERNILTLSANYSAGKVTVTGTTSENILAIAVMLYDTDGNTMLRMESFAVENQSFSAEIHISLSNGTYKVKAADYNGGPYTTTSFTHTSSSGGEGSGSSTGSNLTVPALSSYTAEFNGSEKQNVALPIIVDTKTGTGTANLEGEKSGELFNGFNVISMPSIPGVSAYKLEMPADFLSSGKGTEKLKLKTEVASIIIPDNMLSTIPDAGGIKAAITIAQASKEKLTEEEKAVIGKRPLIQMTLTLNGETTKWDNSNAPAIVSIPYIPTEEELKKPESIVIWYLDGSGELVCIPNGRYNPDSGEVTFTTTHFSLFAVGYNTVIFNDVSPDSWYCKAVSFIAARNITSGTGSGKYSPENQLTRSEFIVLLMRAYGIAPDTKPFDNFEDAGNAYYTNYLSAAKRIGISDGVGNNLFAPNEYITRQEMFTLLYRSLKYIKIVSTDNNISTLSNFTDTNDIAIWAKEAMTLLVETKTIAGSGGKLYPTKTTNRAEIAQVLYNLLWH